MDANDPNANHPDAIDADAIDADAGAQLNRGPPTGRGADAPMSAAQASLLLTLSGEAGEPFDTGLSKADASMRIEALQRKAGREQPKRILEEEESDG